MSNLKKLEQGRAEFAYKRALEGSELEKKKEYKSYVKKIPMLIKTNGLGATFAFMKSKGGTYNEIYKHTFDWFLELKNNTGLDFLKLSSTDDLVEKIISLESSEYRATTVEVLAFFNWLKRFSDGLIKD